MKIPGLTLILAGGLAFAIQAGPPQDAQRAREALDEALLLRDALQLHLEPVATADVGADAEPTRRKKHTRVRGQLASRAVAGSTRATAVQRQAARTARADARAVEHARRSLARVSRQLEVAEARVETNAAFALQRVDLALRELRKAERRLGVELEVQP